MITIPGTRQENSCRCVGERQLCRGVEKDRGLASARCTTAYHRHACALGKCAYGLQPPQARNQYKKGGDDASYEEAVSAFGCRRRPKIYLEAEFVIDEVLRN